ncbi:MULTISPECIES: GNAT family N-acetyltransferase [unclassified Mesorhizobium]|uniref:GNAT family N-acetyltransferase n=1 Tax=unclassified Mesorhizobium TaxID=325217 RepID=UPI0011272931|nr:MULTISPECIES: GNAT family N-acetyltransferase [unclassified Mesorhizobium]TPJ46582.1 GNAT family N-acetyltransferase [Mesorhizobium sp. B2-6-6]MBZ9897256.1 GNAT family N-acetyltransferase [Mesorhizobium sp. BR1-1-6]MBZ9917657.1 GNAT family N-acetyltransferase [Mesorhizobium sp. BR1-1-7]MBZ9970538.1 GNAT family N-acetyltransferase [Mesorhizobium sp. BR1-1-12]MCA0001128.1 GNAT family N-acetyltransferase [Mesorhizobium sp. B264B2A]
MKIRKALAPDVTAVMTLTTDAYASYTALLGGPPIPVTEDYAPRIARGEVWLLESGDDLAGLIVQERHEDHAMIFSVAVAPGFQGKGFGIALLKHADQQARLWGVPEVRLYTNAKMERNIALYLAYGYRETSRRPNPYRPGWVLVDMAKPVDEVTAA